jgi:hypothetical protein
MSSLPAEVEEKLKVYRAIQGGKVNAKITIDQISTFVQSILRHTETPR